MDHSVHNKLVSFIWSIADDCLRDVYVRGKYRDVILPMVVLRRLDTLLEPTKDAVIEEVRYQQVEMELTEFDDVALKEASGYVFYNTSKWTLRSLYTAASNNPEILLANFEEYLDGFSANVKEIIQCFNLFAQIRHMSHKNVLLDVVEKFLSPYINLTPESAVDPDGYRLHALYESSEVEEFSTKYFDSVDAEKLSPIIDIAVARFDAELELSAEDKADFKIKAKQFVKIYGQMASILPYEVPAWEKLYWFLKFLIPKLKIEDPEADALDELLNSVDLNSYGLQRKKLNEQIELDAEETILDPTNPNPRGAHGGETEEDPLDEIIKTFNERWFGGWAATPEEQKVKFVNILKQIKEHADFESKYLNNPDPHTKDLAFDKIMNEVMLRQRKIDMDMYKQYSKDTAFRMSWKYSLQQGVMR